MIVEYLNEVVQKLDKERRCGFCWVFSAPLEEQTGSIRQLRDDECECVHLYITRLNISHSQRFGSVFRTVIEKTKQYHVTFYALIEAELSENNWDEIKDYPISDSRYLKYLKPLGNCLEPDLFSRFCEVLNYPMRITSWSAECIPNPRIYDRDFIGYRVNVTFEKQVR